MADREQLYGLPLERFTPERDALAKQLRGDGDRDGAAAVAALRKPSVAAWAVNQLVRSRRREVKALFDAGDQLQQAQARLLAGSGDGPALRKAVERERAAVDKLLELASGLLSSDGHELTATTRERVSDTFHAAALDEHARSEVSDGCLVRELCHVGLGAGGELAASAPPTGPQKQRDSAGIKAARKAESDARKAESDARKAESDARRAARKAESDARRAAERADRDLQKAQAHRDEAGRALADADQALVEARERAQRATAAHEQAQLALDQL